MRGIAVLKGYQNHRFNIYLAKIEISAFISNGDVFQT
jgi:hypothetical protein